MIIFEIMNRNAVGDEECSSILESKSLAGGKHGAKTLRRVAIGLGTGNCGRIFGGFLWVFIMVNLMDFTDEIDGIRWL